MKTEAILVVLSKLEKSPFLKKTLGQLLVRLGGPASPFFRPLIVVGSVTAVLSAILVGFQNEIAPIFGLNLSASVQLIIQIIGWISATVASMSSLTLNDEGVAVLKTYLGKDE